MDDFALVEDDEDLQRRILYVAGVSKEIYIEVMRAGGAELEAIAERYGLKRRVARL